MSSEQLIGWGLKLSIVFIVIGIIGKLVLISLNPEKMKEFEDKLKRNKSALIMFFSPAFALFIIMFVSISLMSDRMINSGASETTERTEASSEGGNLLMTLKTE